MRPEITARPNRLPRPIRTLVADDEPLARELLGNMVRRDPDLELVGTAASGSEALAIVEQRAPELLLLDVQMPSLDGISVAEQLAGRQSMPYIIFVTAHDSFALQAFEIAVRDYLVKPVSKRRFGSAIRRAKCDIGKRIGAAVDVEPEPLIVRSGEAMISILPDDIVRVAAANQYVRIHTLSTGVYIVSQSLRQFGRSLPEKSFTRIHRSTLINNRHIKGVLSADGRYRVQMCDGSMHPVARNRRALVSDLLGHARRNAHS